MTTRDSDSDKTTNQDLLSTHELVERSRLGDSESLDELCARMLPRMMRWARGRLPRHARGLLDTEDLVQDSLLRTMHNLSGIQVKNEGAFPVYLRTAMLNRIRDAARRPDLMAPLKSDSLESGDRTPNPLEDLIGRDTLERYDRALSTLETGEQAAVVGRIELGISFAELAVILGKPSPDAARMTVGRALAKLAQVMGDE